MKNITLILFLFVMSFSACNEYESQLREHFKSPESGNRPSLNIHSTPYEKLKQDSILDQFLLNGYGGMATNVNWTDDYLKNDTTIQSMFRFAQSARSKGMNVWLYDENWYPSGMAGGYILQEHPDWEVEGLLFKDSLITGPIRTNLNLLPGKLVSVKAVPIDGSTLVIERALDLTQFIKANAIIWNVPAGSWRIVQIATNVLRDGFQSGTDRGGKVRHYPSLLMPEVTQRFIELTHKKYAGVLGEKLGSLFYSTFTDEPSLIAQPYINLGYGVYPWKKNLSTEIEKRFGYKLEDKLLQLMLDDGPEGQILRYQYFSLVSEMMSQNHFRAIKDYCYSQNIKSGGHLLLEESMMAQVPLYGDIIACFREMDIPGIDVLTAMPEFTRRYLYSSRLAASAAELEGRSEVMSEICPIADHRKYNGKEAPTNDVKGTINRQLVGGITRFNNYLQLQHASQEGKMAFNTYVARVSTLMSGGVRASKIAVLYPIETMWTKFKPIPTGLKNWDAVNGGDPDAQKIEKLFGQVSDFLYDNQWEFSYIDSKALQEANVTDGKLKHGNFIWEVLILPGVETLSAVAWKAIETFWKSGGMVVAVGGLPTNSTIDFPSDEIKALADSIFKSKNQDRKAVYFDKFSTTGFQNILRNSIQRDFTISPDNIPVLCSHKKIDGHDVLLVVNDSDKAQRFALSFSSTGKIEKWNPNTGEVSKVNNPADVALDSYNGIIFRIK
jgi:hypothetical protein